MCGYIVVVRRTAEPTAIPELVRPATIPEVVCPATIHESVRPASIPEVVRPATIPHIDPWPHFQKLKSFISDVTYDIDLLLS